VTAVLIGDVVVPISKKGPHPGSATFTYIDLSSVDAASKRIVSPAEVATGEAPSRARQNLRAGDVLVSTVRPNLNGVASVGVHLDGAVGSTGFAVLRADEERLNARYLFHWVRTPRFVESMTRLATGASYPAVSDAIVKSSHIPLPPLPEQRRIAAILDEADALRAKAREAQTSLSEAKSAAFVGATIAHFDQRELGEVADMYGGSSLPTGEAFNKQADGYLLLKVSDMNLGGNESAISRAHAWRLNPGARASTAPTGSVVLPKRGAAIATNKKRVLARPAILDPNLMAVRGREGILHPAWLHAWFRTVDLASIQSGSSVPQLNKQDLVPLALPVPRWEIQLAFAGTEAEIESHVALLGRRRSELDTLFASLQHRAFRGEL
jgi:type I restriction enzyme S subunit